MVNRKYKMLRDTEGQRGGALYSQKVYSLNTKFGNKLIKNRRATIYEPKKIRYITASGKVLSLTRNEIRKRR